MGWIRARNLLVTKTNITTARSCYPTGTGTLRDLIKDEIGVDILEHSKESLFPDTHDMAASPMTIRDTPTPSRSRSADIDDAIPNEELEAILDSHQRDMENMQQGYE